MKTETLFFLFVFSIFISCSNSDKVQNDAVQSDSIAGEIINPVVGELTAGIPSASELLTFIDSKSIAFIPGLTIDDKATDNYSTSSEQATGLGIYMADLAYLVLYKKNEQASKAFNSIYKLSNELHITDAFNANTTERIKNNLDNADSLSFITENSVAGVFEYFRQNKKEKLMAEVSTGMIVETVFITLKLLENKDLNDDAYYGLVGLKYCIDVWTDFIRTVDKQITIHFIANTEKLDSLFEKLDVQTAGKDTIVEKNHKLVLIGNQAKIKLDATDLKNLRKEIYDWRNRLVTK